VIKVCYTFLLCCVYVVYSDYCFNYANEIMLCIRCMEVESSHLTVSQVFDVVLIKCKINVDTSSFSLMYRAASVTGY